MTTCTKPYRTLSNIHVSHSLCAQADQSQALLTELRQELATRDTQLSEQKQQNEEQRCESQVKHIHAQTEALGDAWPAGVS